MPHPIDEYDVAWLNNYAEQVVATFSATFTEHADRFAQGEQLLRRFRASVAQVLSAGRQYFRAVDEAHNELCISHALLEDQGLRLRRLLYEPHLPHTQRSVDFCAEISDSMPIYVDVKTIKPLPNDCWDQYQRAIQERWIPQNVSIVLEEEYGGGELWHYAFASRARMLEYTLELESKMMRRYSTLENALFSRSAVKAFTGAYPNSGTSLPFTRQVHTVPTIRSH